MKRKYTDKFKEQAVELAESLGNITEAGRQLGISDSNIHKWKMELSKESSPKKARTESLQEEIKALKRENAELKKVNHILKAAAAFFSQDQLK